MKSLSITGFIVILMVNTGRELVMFASDVCSVQGCEFAALYDADTCFMHMDDKDGYTDFLIEAL
ncbi:MAG: hypothetical protein ACLFR1_15060, partial [Spirochaetia bacterium]